jgi:hypothetical protein
MVTRYQRGNQKPYIKEEQTIQWSQETKGVIRSRYCLFFFDIRLLITPLVSCGHCIVCSSLIYGFWLPLWYLVTIVLSVLDNTMVTRYKRGNQKPYIKEEQTIQWSQDTKGVIRSRMCIVCSSLIYGFWLHLWYLVTIVLSVLLWYTASDYTFGILWSLYCLFFFDIRLLIIPLVSCDPKKNRQYNGHKIPKV